MSDNLKEKIKNIPVPLVTNLVGVLTLANVYGGLGFRWLRASSMALVAIIWFMFLLKGILYPKKVVAEYEATIPASFYTGFTMTLMILSSFLYEHNIGIGRTLWLIAVIIHIGLILLFTFKHGIKKINTLDFMPAWFVTYAGIGTAVAVGGAMGFPMLQKGIAAFVVGIYFFLLPFIVVRLVKKPILKGQFFTQTVMLAPVSLGIVSYLNAFSEPASWLMTILTILFVLTLIYYVYIFIQVLAFKFVPGYAGLTFPAAIGVIAIQKLVGYYDAIGNESLAFAFEQIRGFQIYIATIAVGYVFARFLMLFFDVDKRVKSLYPEEE